MADQRKGKRYAHYDPAYEAYIRRLLERQQGVPKPLDEGADYYAPPLTKYVDPRDKYAGSPIASGIADVFGGILQPGRASNIEEMNRQYFESRPQQQAQQSALLTDSQLEALKQKASDQDAKPEDRNAAMKLLTSYVRALNPPRTATSGVDWSQFTGEAGRDPAGSAERIDGAPDGADEADAVVEEPLTQGLSARRGGRERLLAQLRPRQLAAAERDLARLNKEISAGGSSGLNPRERFRAFSDEELLAKQAERTKVKNNIRSLEQEIARDQSRPSAGAGGPGQTGAAITQ